ncbi:MAG: hypothetical protein NVSMB68_16320 [Thermoanaerobaculia bacterium]
MKRTIPLCIVVFAASLQAAEIPVQRIADDAKVVGRVAEAAKRDLPQDLLKRILNDDLESLRGKRSDGTYDYATYERLESSRTDQSFSVQPMKNGTTNHYDVKGAFVYRLIIDLPSRRMLVTKNRRVYVDHVEIESIPMNSSSTQHQNVRVEAWVEPGESRPIDFQEVARQATARVFAKSDDQGYGNMVLTLVKARAVDNADSPYADAVASAKATIRALDNGDIPSIRSMAMRMHDGLERTVPGGTPGSVSLQTAARPAEIRGVPPEARAGGGIQSTPSVEIYMELQSVEDLLTGNDAEKREGLDRLHQLVRRLRPR